MSWRYQIGRNLNLIRHAVMQRAPALPFVGHDNWLYDLRRFGGNSLGPIFDVGANVGQTAWGLTRYFPRDPVYCFEPVAATYRKLEAEYGRKARCHRLALGSSPGEAIIHTFEDAELNTLTSPDTIQRATPVASETITVDTVDDFAAREGLERIGLLKMDVQGWELEVLNGAAGMLAQRKIRFVFTEVGFHPRDTDMISFAALNDYLTAQGFVFAGLYEIFRWGPNKRYVGFANALYVLEQG